MEDLLYTSPMHQDIGSSMMCGPMMGMAPGMMMPGMMPGMYGYYGIDGARLRGGPIHDQFEKINAKKTEEKNTAKKVFLGIGAGVLGILVLRKIPFKSAGKAIKSAYNWAADWVKYGCKKTADFFNGLNIPKAPTV